MFNIRTPSGGVKIGPVNLSGEYARQDQQITPQALGIPEDFVQFMKDKGAPLTDLDQKFSTWNAGIAVYLPGGFLPGFMEEVLRPESFNVNYGRSQFEATNPYGQRFEGSDRSRGIGVSARILEGMLGENAPSVGLQYKEPNSQESSIYGNITMPFQQGGMVNPRPMMGGIGGRGHALRGMFGRTI
tara:strand:+ start:34 stop:591 length:558 start_codon:yes stop_codon:yes gene_type:complete